MSAPPRCDVNSLLFLLEEVVGFVKQSLDLLHALVGVFGRTVQLLLQQAQPHVGLAQFFTLRGKKNKIKVKMSGARRCTPPYGKKLDDQNLVKVPRGASRILSPAAPQKKSIFEKQQPEPSHSNVFLKIKIFF